MFENSSEHSRFCALEIARQQARQQITSLLDVYTTTSDPYEHELLAHVLRVGGGYVTEIKRQRDSNPTVDTDHFEGLGMLHRYALQAIAALAVLPATARGLHTMAALLSNAAAFLKSTLDAARPANLEAEV
jgi:hypothetical protein